MARCQPPLTFGVMGIKKIELDTVRVSFCQPVLLSQKVDTGPLPIFSLTAGRAYDILAR